MKFYDFTVKIEYMYTKLVHVYKLGVTCTCTWHVLQMHLSWIFDNSTIWCDDHNT